MCTLSLSHVRLFVTQSTAAHQALLSREFSREEYWNGLPFPSPGNLPNPGIKPTSPALAGRFFTTEPPGKPDRMVVSRKSSLYIEGKTSIQITKVYSNE